MSERGTKVVVVGGTSGIGLAVAEKAVAAGLQVVVASRTEQRVKRALNTLGAGTEGYTVDVMKEESIRDFFAQVGKFHHLVVTAGETPMGGFVTTSVEAAKAVFDSKFWGQYMSAKIAAPSIAEGGSITFFSGSFSRRPASGAAALAATNAAVEGLTRALAVELSPLRVNCIAPGLVVTPMYDGMDKTSRDEMFAQVGASLPAKRVGQPEDIAETALYLMKSRFTTGTVVQIDGGALLA